MQMWRSMQHIGWTVLLGLVIAGCSRYDDIQAVAPSSTSSALVAVDSLMWRQPDSALALLLPWFDSCGDVSRNVSTTFDLHYAHLLLSELLYKNYYEQTNRAELLQAEAYFDSISLIINDSPHILWSHCGPSFRECGTQSPQTKDDLAFLAARAHYMDGVGHYERDSLVPACREYLKALETMEDRFEEKELVFYKANFMAMIYTRLTEVFSSLYLHEQAIYYGERSLRYYKECHASARQIANVLDEIGMHYEMMETLDSADRYFKKAMGFLQDTCNLTYRDLSSHIVYLSYKKGEDPVALLKTMRDLLDLSESQKEFYSRYLTIGDIYYHEGILDSAFFVLDKVFVESNSIASKKQAAEWLIDICKKLGREDEVYDYAGFLVPFANQEENKSSIKSELTELYKRYEQEMLQRQHQKTIKKYSRLAILITVSMFVVLTAIYSMSFHKSKKREKRLEEQMETERKSYKTQQAALAGRLRRSNEALKKAASEQSTYSSPPLKRNTAASNYEDEPICQHIRAICKNYPFKSTVSVSAYASIALTATQKAQLKNAALMHYGYFFEKLKQQYPMLKERDFFYCYLCLLGLDNTQIAVMMQLSYRTIWEREKRLQHCFNTIDKIVIILNEMMMD